MMHALKVFAVAAALGHAVAAEAVERFRYLLPLKLPASGQEELAALVLPPQVYAATRADLADVRVAAGAGAELVPCLVECVTEPREEKARAPVEVRLVKAEELDGQGLRVTLERAGESGSWAGLPVCGLAIRSPLRDYLRRVAVEVSRDGAAWETALADARIADLSSYVDFRQNEVDFAPRAERFLRLTVARVSDVREGPESTVTTVSDAQGVTTSIERTLIRESRPFRIDAVEAWASETKVVRGSKTLAARSVRVRSEPPRELAVRYPEARLICFDASRMPLERLELGTKKGILRLSYVLLEQGDAPARAGVGEWRQAAAGEVARLAFRDISQARMTVRFPESRAACYCLVFADRRGAGDVVVEGAFGADYRVVFPCSPGQSSMLLAGAPDMTEGCGYQPEEIRALLGRGVKPVAAEAAGGWRENPAWMGHKGQQWLAERRWLLPAAVTVAAVALAAALLAAYMRLPEPEE